MLSESESKRMRKRAESIIALGKRQTAKDSLMFAVLLGDAIDVICLLDEIDSLRDHIRNIRRSDFKLINQAEMKLLNQAEIKVLLGNNNNKEN